MTKNELTIKQLNDTLVDFGESITQTLVPIFESFIPAMQQLYGLFWQVYLKAGAPYGETDEGMMRWYKEIGEARRLQNQADRIIQHHKMLADFRQKVRNDQRP